MSRHTLQSVIAIALTVPVGDQANIFTGVLTAMGADLSGSGLPDASAFKV